MDFKRSFAVAGPATSVVLRARDKGNIAICEQSPVNLMLDDGNKTNPGRRRMDDQTQ